MGRPQAGPDGFEYLRQGFAIRSPGHSLLAKQITLPRPMKGQFTVGGHCTPEERTWYPPDWRPAELQSRSGLRDGEKSKIYASIGNRPPIL
jgi:hypothetical protein